MIGSPFATSAGLPAGHGPIVQICFITNDIPASVAEWTRTFGAGPFFHMEHVDLRDVKYYGKPVVLDESIALGYWNDMQIEFIHQHNDTETIYTDWKRGVRLGVHHVLVNTDDLRKTTAELVKQGMVPAMEAIVGLGGEVTFFETHHPFVPFLEVARLDALFGPLFAYMKRAAREWDGSAPLRPVPDQGVWSKG